MSDGGKFVTIPCPRFRYSSRAVNVSVIDAGSAVLYEKVAEAYEPEWQILLGRIYHAMGCADEDALVAQRKEQGTSNAEVGGSSPPERAIPSQAALLKEAEQRILGTLEDFRDTTPEPDETWESWFYAAFDLAAEKVRHILADALRSQEGGGI